MSLKEHPEKVALLTAVCLLVDFGYLGVHAASCSYCVIRTIGNFSFDTNTHSMNIFSLSVHYVHQRTLGWRIPWIVGGLYIGFNEWLTFLPRPRVTLFP